MTAQDTEFNLDLSRRKLLAAAGIGGGAAVAASLSSEPETPRPHLPQARPSDPVATPPVAGLHLQFGADASSEMVVSWHTLQPVRNPRVVLGQLDGRLEQTVEAKADELHRREVEPDRLRLSREARRAARPTSLISTAPCTTAPSRSSGPSAPRRAVARRSPSPASAIRARRPSARSSCRPQGVTMPNPPLCERQSRLAGGRRYHARRRAAAAPVPSLQRRPLLRQSRRGSGADLVGFLGEQQPQRPQPSLDAVARQPRERTRQRADRLSGLSDLFLGAGSGRPDRGDARALVRLHRRLGARDQHRQ